MVRLTFPFFPELRGSPETVGATKISAKKAAFPKPINARKAKLRKACRRFPRFPKCPETGTPDFPAIPAAAIGAAGTITGRENGKDRIGASTYRHQSTNAQSRPAKADVKATHICTIRDAQSWPGKGERNIQRMPGSRECEHPARAKRMTRRVTRGINAWPGRGQSKAEYGGDPIIRRSAKYRAF